MPSPRRALWSAQKDHEFSTLVANIKNLGGKPMASALMLLKAYAQEQGTSSRAVMARAEKLSRHMEPEELDRRISAALEQVLCSTVRLGPHSGPGNGKPLPPPITLKGHQLVETLVNHVVASTTRLDLCHSSLETAIELLRSAQDNATFSSVIARRDRELSIKLGTVKAELDQNLHALLPLLEDPENSREEIDSALGTLLSAVAALSEISSNAEVYGLKDLKAESAKLITELRSNISALQEVATYSPSESPLMAEISRNLGDLLSIIEPEDPENNVNEGELSV